jgi:hypothetical protein
LTFLAFACLSCFLSSLSFPYRFLFL